MKTWNTDAAGLLDRAVERLEQAGAVDLVRSQTERIWRANVDRYDPVEMGDTTRALGLLSAENISESIARVVVPGNRSYEAGLRVSNVGGAFRLTLGGLRVGIVKVPASSGLRPDWVRDFDWQPGTSRALSASMNAAVMTVPHDEPDIEPLFLIDTPRHGLPTEVFVAWAGLLDTSPSTAGWVGLPTSGPQKWLAVSELWRNERDAVEPWDVVETDTVFDSIAVPQVSVRPKWSYQEGVKR